MKVKRIYKKAMAEFLAEYGYYPIKKVPDVCYDGYYNWIYEDTPELRRLMHKYSTRPWYKEGK